MSNKQVSIMSEDDLVNNPTARVPVCLCLDTSGSMHGDSINELNEGVKLFFEAIKEDDASRYSAEICVVTFDTSVRCVQEFSSVDRVVNIPMLKADGMTYMGEGVREAIKRLEDRKKEYQSAGVDYYQPWLILMTDGDPNGDKDALEESISQTVELLNRKKLTIFPIAIGKNTNMDVLKRFSPNRQPLRLQGLKFSSFFSWLSKSVSRTSASVPGEKVPLDLNGIKDWAEL